MNLKEAKGHIRAFLKLYPDDRLAALLAHAQDGKLSFLSCCCLVGSINAPHALQGSDYNPYTARHVIEARLLPGATLAEIAYNRIAWARPELLDLGRGGDPLRLRRLIPMIRSEMRLRDRIQEQARQESELVPVRNAHVAEPFRGLINEFSK